MLIIRVYDVLDKAVVEISSVRCRIDPGGAAESDLIYRCTVDPSSAPTQEMTWLDAAIAACQLAANDLWGEEADLEEWAGRELSDC